MRLGGVIIRTAEVPADYGLGAVLPLVPLSGVLVWVGPGLPGANVLGAWPPDGPMTRVIHAGARPP